MIRTEFDIKNAMLCRHRFECTFQQDGTTGWHEEIFGWQMRFPRRDNCHFYDAYVCVVIRFAIQFLLEIASIAPRTLLMFATTLCRNWLGENLTSFDSRFSFICMLHAGEMHVPWSKSKFTFHHSQTTNHRKTNTCNHITLGTNCQHFDTKLCVNILLLWKCEGMYNGVDVSH